MQKQTIDHSRFRKISNEFILFEQEYSNKFAVIEGKNFTIGFGWNSKEFAEPYHLKLERFNLLILGIYCNVYAINTKNGSIQLTLGLSDAIFSLDKIDDDFLIITETGLIKINSYNCSINCLYRIPDSILDYSLKNNIITINSCSGEKYTYNI